MLTFSLGAASNYAVLFEGGGSNNSLNVTNVMSNVVGSGPSQGNGIGNMGVGLAGQSTVAGPSTLNGSIDFSAANTGQFHNNGANTITGGANFNVSAVTSSLNTVNALNTTLGALPGANVAISGNTTINASSGTFSASGSGYTNVRVFTLTSFSLNNGQNLTINGDANGDSVVVNIPASVGNINWNGNVVLNGISPDNVIFNFVGGSNLSGGKTLSINNNGGLDQGIFLNPNGNISISGGSNIFGRVFGGDSQNFQFSGPSAITAPLGTTTPTLTTTPSPTTVTLGTSSVVLTDSATLTSGNAPTGTITFTLFYNGGATPVDTETVTVSGNGTYTTPTGFTLPTTGTVTGTYQWDASYSGDSGNNPVSDNNDPSEQVTVSAASPTITTSPNPVSVTLGPGPETLTDTATLASGYHPTGTITFTLFYNGGATPVDTETVTVTGNGTYTTPTGYRLPTLGAVTGTYQWDATYNGDPNNNIASDTNALNELVTVSAPRPTLTTTPDPTTVTLGPGPSPILQDTAHLGNGYNPNGTITFQLFYNGSPTAVDTETVTTSGSNGDYTTPTGYQLPTTGTVTGTYQWVASYSDRFGNNGPVTDANDPNEQVTVSDATPTISTTANPSTATVGQTLQDSATLGGDAPTGSITFNLYAPGVNPSVGPATYTETVSGVNGNGTYSTTVGFVSNATGTWLWVATYNGDGNNNSVTSSILSEPVTVSAAQADLQITKTDGKTTAVPGTSNTYTIVVTNAGPNNVTGATVMDTFPANFTGVTWTATATGGASGFTANGSGNINDTVTMPPGSTITYLATGTISPSATRSLSNTATVTPPAGVTDPNPDNNSATDTDTLTPQNDVSVTKTDNKGGSSSPPSTGTVVPGTSFTYTITVSNGGPSTATNVSVSDPVPSGLTSFVWSGNGHTNVSGAISDTIASLAPGATVVYTVTATVSPSATGTLSNTVTVSAANDTNTANNTATDTDNLTPQNDVSVTKTDNKGGSSITSSTGTVVPGTTFTYTITVSNSGPSTATNVSVNDTFPAGIASTTWSGSNGSSGTGTLTDTIASLAPNASVTYTVTALVDPSATVQLVNTVTVIAANDTNSSNNTATDRDNLTPQNDVSVTKVSDKGSSSRTGSTGLVVAGASFTYTITVSNSGPSTATNVSVNDPVPTGLSSFVWSGNGHSNVSGAISDTIASLAPGATVVYTVTATVDPSATGQITNTVTATAANDTNPSNNTATVTDDVEFPPPTVTVSKVDSQGGSSITGSTGTVVPGTSFTYTITVSNTGGSTATNVSVSDPVPSGLTSFVWSGNGQSNVSGAINDTIASLGPGANVVYTVTATADASATGEITNTVTVTTNGVESIASDTDILTPQNNVSVTKTDNKGGSSIASSVGSAVPGTSITYTITVSNSGPSTATNVSVSDPLPAGIASNTWAGSNGSSGTGAVSDTISSLAPGQAVTYTVVANIDPSATAQLANTVTVSAANDINPNNNSATDRVNLTPQNDVSVTKTDNKGGSSNPPRTGTVVPGTSFTYTITVSNSGPSTATNVSVSDPVPSNLTSFVWSGNGHSNVSGAINDTIASLAPGASVVYTVTAAVDPSATGTLSNTVTVSAANDTNPANNSATDTDTLTPQADLQITKTDGKTAAVPGTPNTYTIVVTNAGPSSVTGARVTDTFPATFTGVTWTATATGGASGFTVNGSGNINDTVTMPPGSTITYLATGTISASATGSLSNTATVTPPAGVTDPNTGNNSSTDTDTLTPQADLSILKTNSSTAIPGTNITYTITVTNNGPSNVTGALVSDVLPPGTTFVSATGGASYNPGTNTVNYTTGTLVNGGTASFLLTLAISPSATGNLSNTATVTPPAGVIDPNTGNNSATDTNTLTPQADLRITKTDGKTTAVPGTPNTYTIVVTNAGPSSVTGATVTDTFPANFTNVSYTATATGGASGFTPSGRDSITDTVNMPPGSTITYLATGTISPTAIGSLSNTATVTPPASVIDLNPGNNSATDTDTLTPQADLQITKTDGKTTAVPGTPNTYTIVVTNAGPSSVTGATVKDTFPANFTNVTWTATATGGASGFTASGSGNINDTVTVPPGSSITYLATGTIAPTATGSLINTATVTPPAGVTDPNGTNNSATDTDTLTPQADLQITKTDNKTTAVPGTSNTYTIVVTNAGPSSVTGARVTDTFPATFTNVTYTASATGGATGFTASGSGNINNMVNMPPGSTITYVATGTISPTATGSLTNTATVTPPTGVTDPNPGNNSATDTDTLTPQADLSILKTDSSGSAVPGTNITYTITVTNKGPSTMTGAQVSDVLPPGTTFVSATGGATYNSGTNTVSYTTGTLANGGSASFMLTLAISPTLTGNLSNTATVTPPAGVTDPNSGNNSSTDTDTLTPQADLSILKTDGQTTAVPGTNVTYTITVTNNGPSTMTGAMVSDMLPPGTTFVSATGGATYNPVTNAVSYTTGTLATGGTSSFMLTLAISPTLTGNLSNTATVTPPAGVTDPNPGNNSSTDTNLLTPPADLSILKTDTGGGTAVPGSNVTYTITVTNNGPNSVTGATVSDVLPAGTIFVSATGGATYNSGTNTVSFTTGTLANGGTASFLLTLAISPTLTGSLSNTATVTPPANAIDPNPGNNSSTDTVTLTPQADLSVLKTAGQTSVVPGTNVTYTITVGNNGPSSVTGALVSDVLPAGTTFVSATNGATYNPVTNTVSYTTGTLANGGSTSFMLTLAVSPSFIGSLSNTATVTPPAGVTDPNSGNNSSTATSTLAVSTLTGFVYLDQNNNGVKDPGESGIPNTTVTLTGTDFLGNPVNVSTTTDSNGQYTFSNVLPSASNNPYTITETQPTGYLNGKLVTPTGTFSGVIAPGSNAGTRIQFSDLYSGIAIGPGSMLTGSNFNFGEGLLSNTVPPSQTTPEGTAILFCNGTLTEISISTPDPNQPMQVTVSVPPGTGTLTMASTMGLTFTAGANGTSMMTFQGTANAVNTGLAHLTFMPTPYFSGPATLSMTSQALDSSGNPIPGMTVTSTVPITVTPTNHPPTIQAPATQATHAGVPVVFSPVNSNAITLGDPDVDPAVQVEQLTLSGLNGTVMLGSMAGLVSVSGNGTSSVTLMGTINALNAAVNGLIFTPTSSAPSTAYLMLTLNDLGNPVGPPLQTGRTIAISVT